MFHSMSNANAGPCPKLSAEETARLRASEAELIAAARASAAAGRVVSLEAVEAWVESWDTDHELPSPSSRR